MEPKVKKKTLRLITYGLYVMTAADSEGVAAGTVNWLSQASFEPPLVMVGVKKDSRLHALVKSSGAFAVNIPGANQKEIASACFRPSLIEGDRINGHTFERGSESGAPLLVKTSVWFEARVTDSVERGDHTVFVAEIVNAGLRDAAATPLLMKDTGWFYGG